MRKRQGLIIKALLGWWLFCLAGQCLAMPLYQVLDQGVPATAAMDMAPGMADGGHCAGHDTSCDDSSFLPAIFLLLGAALPLLFWLAMTAGQSRVLRPVQATLAHAQGPPVYLLSQRFRE